jgi:hypothetical protein
MYMSKVTRRFLLVLSIFVFPALMIISGCESGQLPGGAGDFVQISGSGTVTVRVIGAVTGGHMEHQLMYGASGIRFGQYERTGDSTSIGSDTMSVVLPHPDPEVGGDMLFTGGVIIGGVGCVIDTDGNEIADNGDWYAFEENARVDGDTTVTFGYPGDFQQISGSGTITVVLGGSIENTHTGNTLMYGASGIRFGAYERTGNSVQIGSDSWSSELILPNPDQQGNMIFTGGDVVGGVGCIIDVNGNEIADDGDWYAMQRDVVVACAAEGDLPPTMEITFTYPDDFSQITGSGTISILAENLDDDHSGASMMFGAAGIPFGADERVGDGTEVNSNSMLLTLTDSEGADFLFAGGDTVGGVGCIVDVDGSETANDGDWYAYQDNVQVNGDTVVTFTYE